MSAATDGRAASTAISYHGRVMLTRWTLPLVVAAIALAGARHSAAQDLPSFNSAAALQNSGKFEEAAAEYGRFLQAHPDNVEARSNLGVVLMHLGRYEDAIAAYRAALSIAPSNVAVRLNLGLAFYKSDKLAEAVAEFTKVLAAQPENLQASISPPIVSSAWTILRTLSNCSRRWRNRLPTIRCCPTCWGWRT